MAEHPQRIVGIIQNIALGVLVVKFADAPLSVMMVLQSAGSFVAIALISSEYMWWLLVVRRTPRIFDNIVPYALGVAEFLAIAHCTDLSGKWFIYMGVLGVTGLIARWIIRKDAEPEVFTECPWLRPKVLHHHDLGTVLVALMTVLFIWIWSAYDDLSDWWRTFALLEFYALAGIMLATCERFLRGVQDEFENEPIPRIPLRPLLFCMLLFFDAKTPYQYCCCDRQESRTGEK